jgi:hypothetical protein
MISIKNLFRFVIFSVVILTTACSSTKFMVDSMDPLMDKMNIAIQKNSDVELVKEAIPAGLVQLDGMIEASPDNAKLLTRAAEGYNGYSFVFVEDTDKARARGLYLRSFQYATRVLKQKKKFADAFDGPVKEFEESLSVFGKNDVPALFWAASSWLSWAGLSVDDPEIFLALPKIKALLKRCCELDETYQYGAAHTIQGILYATRPVAHGGKPEMAKAEFDRAFELSGRRMLVFHVMYAKYYAYQIQDRDLFITTLKEVLSAPDDLLPDKAFINSAAKKKAKKLLNDVDTIF